MRGDARPIKLNGPTQIVATILFALGLCVGAGASAQVVDRVDSEGFNSSGSNNSLVTAEEVGNLNAGTRRLIRGWVGTTSPADVDFYRFELDTGPLNVFLDVDFADDPFSTEDLESGLDAGLWLFDDEGRLIAWNDDADFFGLEIDNEGTDPGSDALGQRDPFIGPLALAEGAYYVAIAWFGLLPSAGLQPGLTYQALASSGLRVESATPDAAFPLTNCPAPASEACAGGYLIDVRTSFVPEPGLPVGLVIGALTLGFVPRRSRRSEKPRDRVRRVP